MNTKTVEPTGTELTLAPSRELVSNFPTGEEISALVALTRAEAVAAAAEFDVSTAKGRDSIISVAVTVRDKKVKLSKAADESKVEHQAIIKEINAGAKTVKEEFQAVQDEIRKPVTDWEEAEELRVAEIRENLGLLSTDGLASDNSCEELQQRIDAVSRVKIDDDWQEFLEEAAKLKDATLEALGNFLDLATRREAMEKELEERRAADAERERLEAFEAAQAAAECENMEFDERLRLAKVRAYDVMRVQADLDNQAFDDHKAEVASAAQSATKAAEETAEAERVQAEQDRIANENRLKREQEARDRNEELRANARADILEYIAGMNREQVVDAIMRGEIPHVNLTL